MCMHLCNNVQLISEFLICNSHEMVSIWTNYSALLFRRIVSIATGCAVLTECDDTIADYEHNLITACCSSRHIFHWLISFRRFVDCEGILFFLHYQAADHNSRAVSGMKWLYRLKHLDCGSNPTRNMDICLRVFCIYIVLCRQRPHEGLATRPRSPANCL